jgi:hypothetical protein
MELVRSSVTIKFSKAVSDEFVRVIMSFTLLPPTLLVSQLISAFLEILTVAFKVQRSVLQALFMVGVPDSLVMQALATQRLVVLTVMQVVPAVQRALVQASPQTTSGPSVGVGLGVWEIGNGVGVTLI